MAKIVVKEATTKVEGSRIPKVMARIVEKTTAMKAEEKMDRMIAMRVERKDKMAEDLEVKGAHHQT